MKDIYIIGAGVSGLITALELEKMGFQPIILEQSDAVGGRVKTDEYGDYIMDHGFQVLLTAYPEVKRYLDVEELNLNTFEPGAIVWRNGKKYISGDPLRLSENKIKAALSSLSSIKDKWKIYQLKKELESASLDEVFSIKDQSTFDYLVGYGFSRVFIDSFFRPFFGGIYLEDQLETSCRMFRFVFKMFSEGDAAIPEKGIQEVPKQLASKLKKTDIRLNQTVSHIDGTTIHFEKGEMIQADAVVVAVQPDMLIKEMEGQFGSFRTTTNMYFSSDKQIDSGKLIHLVPDEKMHINNFTTISNVAKSYSPQGKSLISVSLNHVKDVNEDTILEELTKTTGWDKKSLTHVKTYRIKKALPIIPDMTHNISSRSTQVKPGVFLAGDYLMYPSLNAAMKSGRMAAEAVKAYYS